MNGGLSPKQLRHDLRRHRREQDTVAEVSGSEEISGHAALAQDGQIVGSPGSQAGPALVDLCICNCRENAFGKTLHVFDRLRQYVLVESAVLDRCPDQNTSIATWDEIHVVSANY